jgi:hypothetical protein
MAGVDRQYTDEIYRETGYLATWAPGVHLELGDCGPLENRIFRRERSVRDFDFKFEADEVGAPIDVDFTSKDGVIVTIQLKGENKALAPQIPAGKAGIDIKFTRENAVVMALRKAREQSVADLYQLQRDLLSHYKSKPEEWPQNYAVVSSVIEADSGTVLIADKEGSQFAVAAEADMKAGLIELASAALGFSVALSNEVSTKILAQEGLRPLFRAFKIKDPWYGGPRVKALDADQLPEEIEIGADESPFEWVSEPAPSLEAFRAQPLP